MRAVQESNSNPSSAPASPSNGPSNPIVVEDQAPEAQTPRVPFVTPAQTTPAPESVGAPVPQSVGTPVSAPAQTSAPVYAQLPPEFYAVIAKLLEKEGRGSADPARLSIQERNALIKDCKDCCDVLRSKDEAEAWLANFESKAASYDFPDEIMAIVAGKKIGGDLWACIRAGKPSNQAMTWTEIKARLLASVSSEHPHATSVRRVLEVPHIKLLDKVGLAALCQKADRAVEQWFSTCGITEASEDIQRLLKLLKMDLVFGALPRDKAGYIEWDFVLAQPDPLTILQERMKPLLGDTPRAEKVFVAEAEQQDGTCRACRQHHVPGQCRVRKEGKYTPRGTVGISSDHSLECPQSPLLINDTHVMQERGSTEVTAETRTVLLAAMKNHRAQVCEPRRTDGATALRLGSSVAATTFYIYSPNGKGLNCNCVMDTGASINIISRRYAKQLGLHAKHANSVTVTGVKGEEIKTSEVVSFRVGIPGATKINPDSWKVEAYVVDTDDAFQVILGTPFQLETRAIISVWGRYVKVWRRAGQWVELPLTELASPPTVAPEEACWYSCDKVTIRPFTQRWVEVQSPEYGQSYGTCFIAASEEGASRGLMVARGLAPVKMGRARVLVANMTARVVDVQVNMPIGRGEAPDHNVVRAYFAEEEEVTDADVQEARRSTGIPPELDLSHARKALNKSQFKRLAKVLRVNSAVWRKEGEPLGAKVGEHVIDTGDARPINLGPRRLAVHRSVHAQKEVQRMEDLGVIRKTKSPWGFPIVLIPKKDGTVRFCVDYRKLNDVTKSDVYPLPRCDDLLASLHGMKYFTAIDLESGFWQINMAGKDAEKTAFVTTFGAWEYVKMPFGLKNAPATFQRTMDAVLAGLKWQCCLVYIDDILIFSKEKSEHIDNISDVFSRLIEAGLKLKPSKCELFKEEVLFVGHLVSASGIRPNPAKVQSIRDTPEPTTTKQVESFLGVVNYFRKFVPDFSRRAVGLYDVKKEFRWGPEQAAAFKDLKEALCSEPVLAHPDPSKPFILETDASELGLGAALLQLGEDGKEHPVEYASRTIRPEERNWHVREKECLAVLWGCENFAHWLSGTTFTVRTDHSSLRVLQDEKKNARLERWAMRLQGFDYKIEYKPGKSNVAADFLSRGEVDVTPDGEDPEQPSERMVLFAETKTSLCVNEIRLAQRDEKASSQMIHYLETGHACCTNASKVKRFRDQAKLFTLKDGCLFRSGALVIPGRFRLEVMRSMHEDHAAHLGYDKILPIMQRRVWWQGMASDLKEYCRACISCARATGYNSERQGMLKPIIARTPWEHVAVDLKGPLPLGKGDERYVLAVMDYFSKMVVLVPIRRKFAAVVAEAFLERVILEHGYPKIVVTDGGSEFKGEFAELMEKFAIDHRTTLPYHHQANGLIERFMQSINKMVRIVAAKDQHAWHMHLSELAFAYNTSYHPAIGDTPYWVANFRDPRLAIDNRLGSEGRNGTTRTIQRREALWRLVRDNLWSAAEQAKSRYDAKQRDPSLKIGDMVLVKRAVVENKTQLLWSDVHRVLSVSEDGLRVMVRPYAQDGKPQEVSIQRIRPYAPYRTDSSTTSEQKPNLPEPIGLKEALTGSSHDSTAESSSSSDDDYDDPMYVTGTALRPSGSQVEPVAVDVQVPPSALPSERVCTEDAGSTSGQTSPPNRGVVVEAGGESAPTSSVVSTVPSAQVVDERDGQVDTPVPMVPTPQSEIEVEQPDVRMSPDVVETTLSPAVTNSSCTPGPAPITAVNDTPQEAWPYPGAHREDPAFSEDTPRGTGAWFFVDQILDAHMRDSRVEFLVKWQGHDQPTWIDYERVADRDLVQEYAERRFREGKPKVRCWDAVVDHFNLPPWPKRRRR